MAKTPKLVAVLLSVAAVYATQKDDPLKFNSVKRTFKKEIDTLVQAKAPGSDARWKVLYTKACEFDMTVDTSIRLMS